MKELIEAVNRIESAINIISAALENERYIPSRNDLVLILDGLTEHVDMILPVIRER